MDRLQTLIIYIIAQLLHTHSPLTHVFGIIFILLIPKNPLKVIHQHSSNPTPPFYPLIIIYVLNNYSDETEKHTHYCALK